MRDRTCETGEERDLELGEAIEVPMAQGVGPEMKFETMILREITLLFFG